MANSEIKVKGDIIMFNNQSNVVTTKNNASDASLELAKDLEKIQTEMSLIEDLPMHLFTGISIDANNTFASMLPNGAPILPLI